MSAATSYPFVTLAHLLRPQGRRGELLAELLTDFPDQLAAGCKAFLVPAQRTEPEAGAERVAIESSWLPTGKNAGRIVLKLAGCDSISEAERLAGARLIVPASERPTLDADTFYVSDLIGATLFDHTPAGDTAVGEVVNLEFATTPDGKTRLTEAAPLLCVRLVGASPDTESALVPFVRAQLRAVDIQSGRIVMELPPGLLDPPE